MKKEAISHGVLDDLANRNENWEKLDGIPEKVTELEEGRQTLTNLIANGDFSDGTTGWMNESTDSTATVSGNELTLTVKIRGSSRRIYQGVKGFNQGDICYISFDMNRSLVGMETIWNGTLKLNWNYPITNTWKKQSAILQPYEISKDKILSFYVKSSIAEVGEYLKLRNVLSINLTQTFGAGNEPTKEEMDILMDTIGYFNDTHTITSKEQFNILLKMVRENSLATTSLGGGF